MGNRGATNEYYKLGQQNSNHTFNEGMVSQEKYAAFQENGVKYFFKNGDSLW